MLDPLEQSEIRRKMRTASVHELDMMERQLRNSPELGTNQLAKEAFNEHRVRIAALEPDPVYDQSNPSIETGTKTNKEESNSKSDIDIDYFGNDIMLDVMLYGIVRGDDGDLGITIKKSTLNLACSNCNKNGVVLISDSENYRSLVASLDSWGTIDCPDWGYDQHAIVHCGTCGHTELRFTD